MAVEPSDLARISGKHVLTMEDGGWSLWHPGAGCDAELCTVKDAAGLAGGTTAEESPIENGVYLIATDAEGASVLTLVELSERAQPKSEATVATVLAAAEVLTEMEAGA